jgi:hypothetical protein
MAGVARITSWVPTRPEYPVKLQASYPSPFQKVIDLSFLKRAGKDRDWITIDELVPNIDKLMDDVEDYISRL